MQNTWQEIGELSQQVLILDNTFEYNGGWPTATALTSPYQENRRRNCYSIVGASVNLARGQWNLDEYGKAILEGIYIEDNRFHNNWQLPGISFCNVVSGTIKGNTFSHDNNDPAYDDIINVRLHKCHTENLKIIDPGRIVITKSL